MLNVQFQPPGQNKIPQAILDKYPDGVKDLGLISLSDEVKDEPQNKRSRKAKKQ